MGLALAIGGAGAAVFYADSVQGTAPALAILSPPGAGYDATNVALYTASGAAVTVTRASTQSCQNAAGSIATVAANKPCVADGALLVEPGATNLLLQSDDIASASWIAAATPIRTANTWDYGTGSAIGDTLADDDAAAAEAIYQVHLFTSPTAFTASAYAREGDTGTTRNRVEVALYSNSTGTYAVSCAFTDLDATTKRKTCTGTPTLPAAWVASTAYALNTLARPTTPNGHWYKVTMAGTSAAGEPTWCTTAACPVTDGTVTWTQQGQTGVESIFWVSRSVADTGSVRLGCVMTETGSVATSCIPTTTTTASRAAPQTTTANPLTASDTSRFCVSATLGSPFRATNVTHGIIASGTTWGTANTFGLYLEPDATQLVFVIWDNAGVRKNWTASGLATVAGTRYSACYDSGAATLYRNAIEIASPTSGAGTGTLSAHHATLTIGDVGSPLAPFGNPLHSIRVCRTPTGCR